MVILAIRILLASLLRLDPECVSTEVISLRLQKICWEILRSIPIVPAESSTKGGCWDTPQRALADNVSPAVLCLVDGFIEKVVEKQILEVWILTICRSDVFQEN